MSLAIDGPPREKCLAGLTKAQDSASLGKPPYGDERAFGLIYYSRAALRRFEHEEHPDAAASLTAI